MSGKQTPLWRKTLRGLVLTAALYTAGVLMLTLLVVRGSLGEERILTGLLVCGCFASTAGGWLVGERGGGVTNAALFAVLLLALCLAFWAGPTVQGLFVIGAVLLGGALAELLCRKKGGKRRGRRLARSNQRKAARSSHAV